MDAGGSSLCRNNIPLAAAPELLWIAAPVPAAKSKRSKPIQGGKMKQLRKIIEIDEEYCDGCGRCVPSCAEGALKIVDGKARVIADALCDGIGACIGECPRNALNIVEREAEAFDEAVVEQHLQNSAQPATPLDTPLACGCPSGQIMALKKNREAAASAGTQESMDRQPVASELAHWPVQIRLIPPHAPFLKNADLLVVADCTAIALPTLHQDLVKERAVLLGCPKLDDAAAYVKWFAAVFTHNNIRSITTVIMEVPCCSGMPQMIEKAQQAGASRIPHRVMVISRSGGILEQRDAGSNALHVA